MRLSATITASVGTRPESARPIRLRIGGLTYGMDTAEAIQLATHLADAVDEIKSTIRSTS